MRKYFTYLKSNQKIHFPMSCKEEQQLYMVKWGGQFSGLKKRENPKFGDFRGIPK